MRIQRFENFLNEDDKYYAELYSPYDENGDTKGSVFRFMQTTAAKGNKTTEHAPVEKEPKPVKANCYYNALAYSQAHPEVRPAVGFIIKKDRVIDHAFCVDKQGKIVDSTLSPAAIKGYTYYWELLPDKVITKFDSGDQEESATAVVDYLKRCFSFL